MNVCLINQLSLQVLEAFLFSQQAYLMEQRFNDHDDISNTMATLSSKDLEAFLKESSKFIQGKLEDVS